MAWRNACLGQQVGLGMAVACLRIFVFGIAMHQMLEHLLGQSKVFFSLKVLAQVVEVFLQCVAGQRF